MESVAPAHVNFSQSGKLALDKAERRMQSADAATVPSQKDDPSRQSESGPSKNVAHKRWRKLFKLFKVSQAFLDLKLKNSPVSSDEETNSTRVTQTKPTVDPIYMALKRAQLMGALREDRFSRSLDLDADMNEESFDELLYAGQGPHLPKGSPSIEETKLQQSVSQSRTSPSDASGQTNQEEQTSTSEGAIQEQTTTKAQGSPPSNQKVQPPVQWKQRIPGRSKEIGNTQGLRAKSQPPAFSEDEPKKLTKREQRKIDVAVEHKAFERHHYRVPPLKKMYVVMQEKEAAFNEKMKSRRRPDIQADTYAVIHEFRAKFPGELDLRPGDRVTILDARDPDWWTGLKTNELCGRFPSTSVHRIRLYEQILQVKQNLQLWDNKRKLRIYRDQIVFGQGIMENGFITIRTASNHYINCPVQHLLLIK